MKSNKLKFQSLLLAVILCLFPLSSCATSKENLLEYYSDNENYTEFPGTIKEIYPDGKGNILLSIVPLYETELIPKWSGNYWDFKLCITNKNLELLESTDFDLSVNSIYSFVSAPRAYYVGWRCPIVEITDLDKGKTFLSFEKGKANWLDYINENF